MKLKNLKYDKGQAGGITILLSLIVIVFIIGLLVMIFSLMGSSLQTSTYTSTTANVVNESITKPTTAGITFATPYRSASCGAITASSNGTNGINIAVANYTQTGCVLTNTTSLAQWGTTVLISYPVTYSADNDATNTMNDTIVSMATVSTYFPLFITIGAMVVLILLTVLIIVAIRSSGLMQVGTA